MLNFKPAVGCNYLGNAVRGTVHRESRLRSLASKAPLTAGQFSETQLSEGHDHGNVACPRPTYQPDFEGLDRAYINPVTHLSRYCSTNIGATSDVI